MCEGAACREAAGLVRLSEQALSEGLALRSWFQAREPVRGFADWFDLEASFSPPGESYGFFDVASAGGRAIPVMGVVQTMAFDMPKSARPQHIRDELREFVLHYFMRVSSYRLPVVLAEADRCGRSNSERAGFGYSQFFFKLSASGHVGTFPPVERYRIVDLRELSWKYDWIITKVDLFAFHIRLQPFGADTPWLEIPLAESNFLVINKDLLVDEQSTDGSGRFGFGYALVRNPVPSRILAYGPGEFDAGFKTIEFLCDPRGVISVRMAFCVNRPRKIVNLPVDPVFALIDLANLITLGGAARDYCISRRDLEIDFLKQHFLEHYDMMNGGLATWSQVYDWLDPSTLPDWVRRGVLA